MQVVAPHIIEDFTMEAHGESADATVGTFFVRRSRLLRIARH